MVAIENSYKSRDLRMGLSSHISLRFFELARVFVRFGHVARYIVNANHSIV